VVVEPWLTIGLTMTIAEVISPKSDPPASGTGTSSSFPHEK